MAPSYATLEIIDYFLGESSTLSPSIFSPETHIQKLGNHRKNSAPELVCASYIIDGNMHTRVAHGSILLLDLSNPILAICLTAFLKLSDREGFTAASMLGSKLSVLL